MVEEELHTYKKKISEQCPNCKNSLLEIIIEKEGASKFHFEDDGPEDMIVSRYKECAKCGYNSGILH